MNSVPGISAKKWVNFLKGKCNKTFLHLLPKFLLQIPFICIFLFITGSHSSSSTSKYDKRDKYSRPSYEINWASMYTPDEFLDKDIGKETHALKRSDQFAPHSHFFPFFIRSCSPLLMSKNPPNTVHILILL